MSQAEYHDAIDHDAQLLALHKRCITEVLLGPVKSRREE